KNSGDPYRYKIIGFGESVNDFSDVEFPQMPGGTGFNQQTRNCGACHDGAADGDRAYTNPSRQACTGCHDDLNFSDGTVLDPNNATVKAGQVPQGSLNDPSFRMLVAGQIPHTFGDDQCALCHKPGTDLDPKVLHQPVLLNPDRVIGLKVAINSVTGNSGPGFF